MATCHECEGSGLLDPTCPDCDGEGWIYDNDDEPSKCPACNNAPCPACNGKGYN